MKELTGENSLKHQEVEAWKEETDGTIHFKILYIVMANHYQQGCLPEVTLQKILKLRKIFQEGRKDCFGNSQTATYRLSKDI